MSLQWTNPAAAPAQRNRRTHDRSAILISGAAALTLLGALPALAEGRIIEGRSVAGVQLGDTQAEVRSTLGRPERGSNVLSYQYVRRHGLAVYFIAGRAFDVTVLRRPQATRKGIRIGSTRAALARQHPGIRCRPAAVGRRAFECTLRSRFQGRATETMFTTRNNRVARIAVRFA